MFFRELPGDEKGDAHHGRDAQRHDIARGEPVVILALVKHELQAADAHDQQHQADHVDGRFAGGSFPPVQGRAQKQQAQGAHRHIDEENPAPVVIVADPAAQDGPQNGSQHHHHGPEREGQTAFFRGIAGQQQALGKRQNGPGRDALHQTEKNQHAEAAGNAA